MESDSFNHPAEDLLCAGPVNPYDSRASLVGPNPDVERLTRWTAAGGRWRVVVRTPTSLTVALLTCDGGEEMERIVSSDSAFAEHVGVSSDSES